MPHPHRLRSGPSLPPTIAPTMESPPGRPYIAPRLFIAGLVAFVVLWCLAFAVCSACSGRGGAALFDDDDSTDSDEDDRTVELRRRKRARRKARAERGPYCSCGGGAAKKEAAEELDDVTIQDDMSLDEEAARFRRESLGLRLQPVEKSEKPPVFAVGIKKPPVFPKIEEDDATPPPARRTGPRLAKNSKGAGRGGRGGRGGRKR